MLVEAPDAHHLLILLHILLPVQAVTAVETVGAIGHGGAEVTPGTCGTTSVCETVSSPAHRHTDCVSFGHHTGAVLICPLVPEELKGPEQQGYTLLVSGTFQVMNNN